MPLLLPHGSSAPTGAVTVLFSACPFWVFVTICSLLSWCFPHHLWTGMLCMEMSTATSPGLGLRQFSHDHHYPQCVSRVPTEGGWGAGWGLPCCEMQRFIQQCQSRHSFPTSTDGFNHIISRCDTAASDDELFILTRLSACLSEMPSVPALPSLGEKAYVSSDVGLYFCDVSLLRNHCSTRG